MQKKAPQIANKALKNYEEYMVDKTLMKKINSVKSTIKNSNDYFSRQINSMDFNQVGKEVEIKITLIKI